MNEEKMTRNKIVVVAAIFAVLSFSLSSSTRFSLLAPILPRILSTALNDFCDDLFEVKKYLTFSLYVVTTSKTEING